MTTDSPGFVELVVHYLRFYNGSVVTLTAVCLTATNFKPLIFFFVRHSLVLCYRH